MTWKQLLAENRVAAQPASRTEIKDLRAVVHRNLSDAQIKKLSDDGRFGHAYDAARILANIMVRASGYRVKSDGGGHYNTFLALKAADPAFAKKAVYFDACRESGTIFFTSRPMLSATPRRKNFFGTSRAFPLKSTRG